MSELSVYELETERGTLLPAREALGIFSITTVLAANTATSVQAVTLLSHNHASANQLIIVSG
jgi:hypothetical protein